MFLSLGTGRQGFVFTDFINYVVNVARKTIQSEFGFAHPARGLGHGVCLIGSVDRLGDRLCQVIWVIRFAKPPGFASPDDVERRYAQINAFEKHLSENGVTLIKCMLNVGYEEQGIRLRERLEEEHKYWKFNPADLDDRGLWKDFMAAYETAVQRCSTDHAPWYVIPADSRTRRNAMIARLVRGALEDMDLSWPGSEYRLEDFDFS